MFRNNYDNDSVTYSPTGRLFQVEYALEAIKQGSAAVGLTSNDYVVLVALKRNAEELGSYQKKIIKIDDHMGVALAGLAPDAESCRTFAQAGHAVQDGVQPSIQTHRAVLSIADKAQENTQSYGSRPYGVGLLIAGYDETGAHLFEFQPSGSVLEYFGAAIGARSQAARTYLERNLEEIKKCDDVEQLVVHGLYALRDTLSQDVELTFKNTSVAIVGKDQKFVSYDDEDVQQWLDKLDSVSNTRNRDDGDEDAERKEVMLLLLLLVQLQRAVTNKKETSLAKETKPQVKIEWKPTNR
ncbi:putative proteasome subunit alpha type-6 [Candida viswanathii]|uniref:Proteasome subunit alpha type n=1 Tax=Candida viswanathii TaxID=5486 RepID=A0A367YHT7_9ASCO|nr:putative proteasome subunit alpha type-6 [Candida viswanathii]